MKPMKAVILVGGEGTRLRPLTLNTPKPMVPIVNRPFLEHMVRHLKEHSIEEIVLALCYLPHQVEHHFGDGRDFGVRLTYAVEDFPLGTAGAVKNVEQWLDETFFVFNGDVFTDLDLSAMLDFHREKGAKASIALTPVENPTAYGLVETNADNKVLRFIEKPSWESVTTNLINAGTYILEPEVLKLVPPGTNFMFERGLFPLLLEMGQPLYGYQSRGYWIDMGTPEHYLQLNHDLLMKKIEKPFPGKPLGEGIWVEEECFIHPTTQFVGPVVIGRGCVIDQNVRIAGPSIMGEQCTIGQATVIEGAILWQNARVGERVTMSNCVVGQGSLIGDNTWISGGSIIGDNVIIGSGNKLEHGIRVWPGKTLERGAISF